MKKLFALAVALVLTLGASTGALAAWLVTGEGTGQSAAGGLTKPATPTAARQSPATSVQVSWTGVVAANDYVVHRFTTASATTGGTPICSTAATTCLDTAVATNAAHWYRVTARRHSWSSPISDAASVPSAVVSETFAVQLTQSGSKTAGTAFDVTITALDDGATSTGYTGSKVLAFSGPGSSPDGTAPTYPASVTFANGVATASITLTRAETAALQVSEAGRSGSTSIPVQPAMTALSFSNCPRSPQHSTDISTSIKRPSTDAYGNSTLGSSAPVSLTPSGNGTVSTGSVTISSGTDTSPWFTIRVNGNKQTGTIVAESPGHHSASCTLNS